MVEKQKVVCKKCKKMKYVRSGRTSFDCLSFAEAIAAIYGAVITGLERNLAGLSTLCADSIVHLTITAVTTTGSTLAGIAAGFATLRLIGKASLRVKFLLSGSENKFLSTVFADERFVLIHVIPLQI